MSDKKLTFAERMRIWFRWFLDPLAGFFNRLGLMPNTMTLIGLAVNTLVGYLLAAGQFMWGGIIMLALGPIDALDGAMARLRGMPTQFGGFVDSVTDRYSELATLAGLMYYFVSRGDTLYAMLTFAATAGSVLVSYVKARAEAVGFDANTGLLTRIERILVLAPCLIFGAPEIALWIIAILANVTALQRILHVRKQAHLRQS